MAAQLNDLTVVFVSIVLQSLPFVLVGVLIASFVRQHLREEMVARWMPRHPFPAVLVSCLFGMVAPVCDCGALPLGRRLIAKGAPVHAVVGFVVAAPVMNPVTLVATAIAFQGNLGVVAVRAGMTLSVAVCVALLTVSLFTRSGGSLPTLRKPITDSTPPTRLQLVGHVSEDLVDVLFFVVLGALFTAASQTLIPRADVAGVGAQAAGSVLAVMPVASILSICSEADAFVARAFATNFSPGAVLAFMTIGQIVDLRNAFLMWRTLGGRLLLLVAVTSYPMVFLEGVLLNRLVGAA